MRSLKNNIILKYTALFVIFFATGFGAAALILNGTASASTGREKSCAMRVYDGEIEFFNGESWYTVENAEELRREDPFYEVLNKEAVKESGESETEKETAVSSRGGGTVTVSRPRAASGSAEDISGSTPPAAAAEPDWSGDVL